MKPTKTILLLIIGFINLFAQSITINDIPYQKHTAMMHLRVEPFYVQYSFNNEHDIG